MIGASINFGRVSFGVTVAFAMSALLAQGQPQPAGQPRFPSAEDAHRSLLEAVQNHDDRLAMKILGVTSEAMLSGDEVQDKLDREQFIRKYGEMHRLGRESDGVLVLYVGAENWPFPFPLISTNGEWQFDSRAGLDEVLYRRIGDNETAAVERLMELVESRKQSRATATVRDVLPGDGPLYGYYFRTLPRGPKNAHGKDDFGFVAYPAAYRSCGVMTFIVNQNDVVYEKDLGPQTAKRALAIARNKPGRGWHATE